MTERKQLIVGIGLVIVGTVTAIAASILSHAAEAPTFNEFGQEIFPLVPRSWQLTLAAQSVALGGTILVIVGITLAVVYNRPLTWATAMVGALLFTSLMFVLFAIVPNQMLTLFQSTLEWTPQKNFFTVPPVLVLNNEVRLSYAVVKDMIVAGYATTVFIIVPIVMYQWQERAKKADVPKPTPVSDYGRPLRADS